MFLTDCLMNLRAEATCALLAASLLVAPALTQTMHFDSGSTGADGAFLAPAGQTVVINMDDHADGVFNFTSFTIENGATVNVQANENNTPLVILVQDDVFIDGLLQLSGQSASGIVAGLGGPGGWQGGVAGRVAGGTFPPGPGLGPGGGAAVFGSSPEGTGAGKNTFMKPSLVPQIGGSGGGGGEAVGSSGGAGGGGGGALTFAVSGTFDLGGNGRIHANGGNGGASAGGSDVAGSGGSGGSVRIIATTIDAGFQILASGGAQGFFGPVVGDRRGEDGIIRFEAFEMRGSFSSLGGRVFNSLPGLVNADGTGLGTLRISQIGGVNVPADAGSNPALPDVIIPAGISNPVTIQVTAQNVTPGQTANLRIHYNGEGAEILEATTTPLAGTNETSTATASVNLNAGSGVMTAILTTPMTRGEVLLANDTVGRLTIDGEPVARIEKESTLGVADSAVTYVTESGKKVTMPAR